MTRIILTLTMTFCVMPSFTAAEPLRVGFAERDITPKLNGRPVYIAGFGHNRIATAVEDPILVRAMVLTDGQRRIAIASADLIGLFLPSVEAVRSELTGFDYILVCCTHNHHGPDTMGLWGPTSFVTGLDKEYLRRAEREIAAAIRDAAAVPKPALAVIASASLPELLHDSRPPIVKHDELMTIQFRDPATAAVVGTVVQWNCHPETIDPRSPRLSADYVGHCVKVLKAKSGAPALYLTGTVGGLMTSMRVKVAGADGMILPEGSVEKTREFGRRVAVAASDAMKTAKPVTLTPMEIRTASIALPVENKLYRLAGSLGVLDREMEIWSGDPRQARTPAEKSHAGPIAVRSEVGYVRLGDVEIAVIPGEIYPELVLGRVPDPTPAGADYPDAAVEPAIYAALKRPYKMIVGLANDELGYILPKRQWDERPPFTFELKNAPYGEINSLGPDTAAIVCRAFRELAER